MDQINKSKNNLRSYTSVLPHSILQVIKSKYFYFGILSVIAGAGLNFASETYLHNYMSAGKTLPMLSDLILDNLPFYNVSLIYDIFCLVPIFLVLLYFVHKKDYNLSLIHISEPTRLGMISYAVFCLKKKKKK